MLAISGNPLLREHRSDEPARILRRRSVRRQTKHMLAIANAAKDIESLPGDEESILVIMRGNFHGWDLVPAILKLATPAVIEDLSVATLGFNKSNAEELLGLIDASKVRRVQFIASCYFKASCPDEFRILAEGLKSRGMPIVAARSHAKILAMRLSSGEGITVESSANLRSCRNIEQFCMTNSDRLYEFHRQWISEIVARGDQEPRKAKS